MCTHEESSCTKASASSRPDCVAGAAAPTVGPASTYAWRRVCTVCLVDRWGLSARCHVGRARKDSKTTFARDCRVRKAATSPPTHERALVSFCFLPCRVHLATRRLCLQRAVYHARQGAPQVQGRNVRGDARSFRRGRRRELAASSRLEQQYLVAARGIQRRHPQLGGMQSAAVTNEGYDHRACESAACSG